jgi:hypothetical protein
MGKWHSYIWRGAAGGVLAALLGLAAVPGVAQAQGCASGSTVQPGYFRGDGSYAPAACYRAFGGNALQPGALYLGDQRQYYPPPVVGPYGAGGASVAPGEYYPRVAGQRINPGQLGSFYYSQGEYPPFVPVLNIPLYGDGGYGAPWSYPASQGLPPADVVQTDVAAGPYSPPPAPGRGGGNYIGDDRTGGQFIGP